VDTVQRLDRMTVEEKIKAVEVLWDGFVSKRKGYSCRRLAEAIAR
jgi:hypothetical protein